MDHGPSRGQAGGQGHAITVNAAARVRGDPGPSPNGPGHDFHRTAEHTGTWMPHGKPTGEVSATERGSAPEAYESTVYGKENQTRSEVS